MVVSRPQFLMFLVCPVMRRQSVVKHLFVYQTSVFTLYSTERRSSYTALSFIRFANINVE